MRTEGNIKLHITERELRQTCFNVPFFGNSGGVIGKKFFHCIRAYATQCLNIRNMTPYKLIRIQSGLLDNFLVSCFNATSDLIGRKLIEGICRYYLTTMPKMCGIETGWTVTTPQDAFLKVML